TLAPVNARYVKMYAWARATSYGYSLWEFQVYGSGAGPTPTATPTRTPTPTARTTARSTATATKTATPTATSSGSGLCGSVSAWVDCCGCTYTMGQKVTYGSPSSLYHAAQTFTNT